MLLPRFFLTSHFLRDLWADDWHLYRPENIPFHRQIKAHGQMSSSPTLACSASAVSLETRPTQFRAPQSRRRSDRVYRNIFVYAARAPEVLNSNRLARLGLRVLMPYFACCIMCLPHPPVAHDLRTSDTSNLYDPRKKF